MHYIPGTSLVLMTLAAINWELGLPQVEWKLVSIPHYVFAVLGIMLAIAFKLLRIERIRQ